MRFPAQARIRSGDDFKACFAARQRLPGRYFLLQWRANEGACARLGLAVSRRVDRRAVVRNRIKRLTRESFRVAQSGLPPCDLVLVAKPEAAKASNAALSADLEALWRRLGALPPPSPQGTMPAASSPPGAGPVTPAPADPT